MKVTETALPGVLVIEPRVFRDERGYFLETYHAARYAAAGIPELFVQDNLSSSRKGTVRGLHFQEPEAQGKLVQAIRGHVFDVVVDVRRGSPTFGRFVGIDLTDDDLRQMWVPPGFAHGFCAASDEAVIQYRCTALYTPAAERTIAWNDPDLGIPWPVAPDAAIVSAKDAQAPRLRDAPILPTF